MQHYILLALVALFVSANAENLIVGEREEGDELMKRTRANVDSTFLMVAEDRMTIVGDGKYAITMIEALDVEQMQTPSGVSKATAQITAGGLGHNHVTLDFISKRGNGIHFHIRVFGKKRYV